MPVQLSMRCLLTNDTDTYIASQGLIKDGREESTMYDAIVAAQSPAQMNDG